ncbi:MAG: alanine racemase, partial [Rhodospirillaceae bacterium]|nr:alanine racemase [Rhodospirillaceae bacterium]
MTRRAEPASAVQTGEAAGVLTVDLDALAANWRLLRDRMGGPEAGRACAAVVKADGYG